MEYPGILARASSVFMSPRNNFIMESNRQLIIPLYNIMTHSQNIIVVLDRSTFKSMLLKHAYANIKSTAVI